MSRMIRPSSPRPLPGVVRGLPPAETTIAKHVAGSEHIARLVAIAKQIAFLEAVTGWPVQTVQAHDGIILIADQFVVNRGHHFFVAMKIPHEESAP